MLQNKMDKYTNISTNDNFSKVNNVWAGHYRLSWKKKSAHFSFPLVIGYAYK